MSESPPSSCTSPLRSVVRITASLGSVRLASCSSTVKVASEPSDTTNVTPSTSPVDLGPVEGAVVGAGDAGAPVGAEVAGAEVAGAEVAGADVAGAGVGVGSAAGRSCLGVAVGAGSDPLQAAAVSISAAASTGSASWMKRGVEMGMATTPVGFRTFVRGLRRREGATPSVHFRRRLCWRAPPQRLWQRRERPEPRFGAAPVR